MLAWCLGKKNEFGRKTAGDISTDKRFFTDKPLINKNRNWKIL